MQFFVPRTQPTTPAYMSTAAIGVSTGSSCARKNIIGLTGQSVNHNNGSGSAVGRSTQGGRQRSKGGWRRPGRTIVMASAKPASRAALSSILRGGGCELLSGQRKQGGPASCSAVKAQQSGAGGSLFPPCVQELQQQPRHRGQAYEPANRRPGPLQSWRFARNNHGTNVSLSTARQSDFLTRKQDREGGAASCCGGRALTAKPIQIRRNVAAITRMAKSRVATKRSGGVKERINNTQNGSS